MVVFNNMIPDSSIVEFQVKKVSYANKLCVESLASVRCAVCLFWFITWLSCLSLSKWLYYCDIKHWDKKSHVIVCWYGLIARYVKLRVVHVLGMVGTFSLPPRVSDPDMHHGTCVRHIAWCMPGSPTNGFVWSEWRGKHFLHSRHMRTRNFT